MRVRRKTRRKRSSIRVFTRTKSSAQGTQEKAAVEPNRERLRTDAFENPGRILVVDDDDGLRDTVASLLERDLHTVLQACNGQEALDIAFKEKPDVVVLDIKMPVMDGFTACQRLKADPHLHYVPVLVLTAAADPESQTRALECGANDFLAKPVSGLVLTTRVRALLKYRRALQLLEQHQTEMERRVEERTAELRETGERLRKESEERRKAQESLESERALLRTVIDTIPDAVFMKDTNGRFLVANQRVADDAGGKSSETLIGKTDFDLYPHEDATRFQALEQEILRVGRPVIGREFQYTYPDGRQVHTSTTKLPLRDKSGKVIGLLGIHRNITQQKKAELALAAERATLRMMIDNLPDSVFLKDSALRFVAINKNVPGNLGAKRMEDVLGKTDFDFIPPEVAQAFFEEEQAVLTTGQPIVNKVVKFCDEDGHTHYHLNTKLPLRDSTGRITGLLGINRDITEQKRMEQELANERVTLRMMIDNLPDIVFLKDSESRFVVINKNVLGDLGAKRMEDVLGKTDLDFYPQEMARRLFEEERAILTSGQPMVNKVITGYDEKGTFYYHLTTKLPLRDTTGRITGLLGINRNIADQKQMELDLANERATLRTMIDNMPDQIFLKDLQSRFVMCSQNVVTSLGFTQMSDVIGKTDLDILPRDPAERHFEEEQEIMRSGEPMINKQESYVDKEGQQRCFLSTKIPMYNQDHRVIGLLGINRDVSEYKKLEQQLRQAQKMDAVGQLAGGIAHDFNNMLMVILGYAECLQMESQLLPPHRKQVAAIHHAAERASRLTRQLLTFSRRQVMQLELVSLNAVLTDMGQMLQRLIGEHIRMETRLSPDAVYVRADAGQLQQVVMNLVLNARDAMPNGGELILEISAQELGPASPEEYRGIPHGSYVVINVTDTGHGMSPETQARIFEPFFTTKPFGKGTGLGLSVVYGVVKQVGGHILMSSEVDRGTTFTLFLPVATVEGKKDAVALSPRPDGGTETILLVEDEDEVRGLARVFLTQHGYQVMEESDPVLALKRAATFPDPIHLLITDVLMPNLNGAQFVEEFQAERPDTKILYISGYPAEAASSHGVLSKDHGFLQKPFSAMDLSRKVREVLDRTGT